MEDQLELDIKEQNEDISKHYHFSSFFGKMSAFDDCLKTILKYKTLVDSLEELGEKFDVKTYPKGNDIYVKVREK